LLQSFEVRCCCLSSDLRWKCSFWFAERWGLLCSLAFPGTAWCW